MTVTDARAVSPRQAETTARDPLAQRPTLVVDRVMLLLVATAMIDSVAIDPVAIDPAVLGQSLIDRSAVGPRRICRVARVNRVPVTVLEGAPVIRGEARTRSKTKIRSALSRCVRAMMTRRCRNPCRPKTSIGLLAHSSRR